MTKPFVTPPLPYDYNALEPYIDEATMKVHHDKHHVAYTTKLNATLENHSDWFEKSPEEILMNLDQIPGDIRMQVRNFGGGHVNHAMFWEIMAPKAGGKPEAELSKAIEKDFGSYEKFQTEFENAANTQFGSGWAWLSFAKGKLIVEKTANQDSPLSLGHAPLLLLDVWEHAYYLKYKNMRQDYVKAFWNVVNWKAVLEKFLKIS
ncbi:MAG: superoxide dismutase [Candidatus Kerfeldbacteria bacterium CG08_land_8_20_14_0_20_43_14]|uniref:Superoxide dismutase n=1 Tax=Candidatus Kerfeldbacteria bacterium CG08_land_8_20_14_0_20_43_14 TaxID=2014246 RepID=A0A2H0YQT2_9BACT|nr:MAG: superoxide dismutase [Candidatus Kerfeldbacteria bacterium CG08_land_8_20_14_0_20_43_14]